MLPQPLLSRPLCSSQLRPASLGTFTFHGAHFYHHHHHHHHHHHRCCRSLLRLIIIKSTGVVTVGSRPRRKWRSLTHSVAGEALLVLLINWPACSQQASNPLREAETVTGDRRSSGQHCTICQFVAHQQLLPISPLPPLLPSE